jgi:hypothetical protein
MKTITALESSSDPLDLANLSVVDANAWIAAACRRIEKANKLLGGINTARAAAKPPLPPIPPIPPIAPITPIEAPMDPDPRAAPTPT